MCLAVPLKIVEKNGADGIGEFDGVKRRIRLDFVPAAEKGDYVIVHAGFAIEKLLEEETGELEKLWEEIRELADP